MSDGNDRCPECEGEGFKEDGYHPNFGVDCEKCEGTGRNAARAGVGCAALVEDLDAAAKFLERWGMTFAASGGIASASEAYRHAVNLRRHIEQSSTDQAHLPGPL
jgi:hypothetical protein